MTKQDQQRADRILAFIREAVDERGYPPSVREIAEAVGLASTSAVHHQPVIGEIAAGQPIHAYEERSETIGLPSELAAGRGRETFVLRVRGKSMIDDHIDDGDFVVVQEQNTARDGDIVVAVLEDNVATLKRFYKEKDRIRLQPANGTMSPIYARDVEIQGKVIGVIRKLS